MHIWGWFSQMWFWIKRGNLCPIMIILRTGRSSIILGCSKMLKLPAINFPHWATAIDWLNTVYIWLWMLALLYLSLILLLPFRWSCNKTKYTSGISYNFWFNLSMLFCILCQMPFNAHLFAAHTNSYCCWIHKSFEMDFYNYTGTTPTSYHK